MEQQINTLERTVILIAHITQATEEIKNAITRSMYFYLHFQIQVLAIIGSVYLPSTVAADSIRNILMNRQERLLALLLGTACSERNKLLAYYKLEASYLAVNPERTQYILVDEDHTFKCSHPTLKICNVNQGGHSQSATKFPDFSLFDLI